MEQVTQVVWKLRGLTNWFFENYFARIFYCPHTSAEGLKRLLEDILRMLYYLLKLCYCNWDIAAIMRLLTTWRRAVGQPSRRIALRTNGIGLPRHAAVYAPVAAQALFTIKGAGVVGKNARQHSAATAILSLHFPVICLFV